VPPPGGGRGQVREGNDVTRTPLLLAGIATLALSAGEAGAQSKPGALGEGMTMYMQMGGNPGDGATWARQTGAADAAKAYGIRLIEQFSSWQPEKMLDQFREAAAGRPTCIGIMGHPGNGAFADLVADARSKASSSPAATPRSPSSSASSRTRASATPASSSTPAARSPRRR
jgi:hypothetical protein